MELGKKRKGNEKEQKKATERASETKKDLERESNRHAEEREIVQQPRDVLRFSCSLYNCKIT